MTQDSPETTEHDEIIDQTGKRSLVELVVQRPVAVIMVACLVVVFGVVSYERLTLTLMPDIAYPTITVRTEYAGAAPEEVETVVSRPMEQSLGVVNHLVNISSVSRAELSDVLLEFAWGTDMSEAAQDIREQLERVRLPDEVERPLILRYDPSLDPIMRVALWGDGDLFTLRRLAEEEVQRALETLDGVAAVRVRGGLEQEILVEVSEEKLALLSMNIGQIVTRLRQENVNLSGGQLREGLTEYMVRTLNEFQSLDEIRNLVITDRRGVPIRLSDIATVTSTNKEREVITRISGTESVEIEIFKEGDANIVEVAQRVRSRLIGTEAQQAYVVQMEKALVDTAKGAAEKFKSPNKVMLDFVRYRMPQGTSLDILSDQSTFIKASIAEVTSTAILGGLLAVIILYLFLRNLQHTLIVAVAIPVSIVATFAGMYLGEVSLNIMSLGGLALGVGMLVDNSIVVLESIFRCREEGDDIISAAVRGTREVGGAVIASTLTTIAVFLPIVFVEGVAGQVFGDLSLTVVFSLLASLAVALWFIPMLASRRFNAESTSGELVDRLRGAHVARLRTLELLKSDSFIKVESNSGRRLMSILKLVAGPILVMAEVAWGVIRIAAAVVIVTLRLLAAVLVPISWPVLVPVSKNRDDGMGAAARTARWLESEQWWQFYVVTGHIWPPILSFGAPEELRSGMVSTWAWATSGVLWKRILKAVPGIVRAVLVLARFIIHAGVEYIGKLVVLAAVMATLLVVGFMAVLGMILYPIFVVLAAIFEVVYGWTERIYPRVISSALDHRGIVIAIATALFALTTFVFLPQIGSELIPQVHQAEFYVDVELPVGSPIEATDRVIRRVERMARSIDGVKKVAATVGAEKSAAASSELGENTGRVSVALTATSDLEEEELRVMNELRGLLTELSQVEARMALPALFSFKTPIEVEIKGYSLERLRVLSENVRDRLARLPGFRDVETNVQTGNPEVRITYDRQRLAELGLTPYQVATLIRTKVKGDVATKFRDENMMAGEERRVDVRVQVTEEDKAFISNLNRMIINPGQDVPVPLDAVANIEIVEGPSEIRRISQQRAAVVSANLDGVDLGTATQMINTELRSMEWPGDISYMVGGQNAEMQTSLNSLFFALALAVFLIYVVMASQFESFLHPFVIMFSIPLALIGVVGTLWAIHVPLSVVVFLGIIVLAGIVVNNAIVLVDYVNQLRRDGAEKRDALIRAGQIRLRPILMTTLTTVLGLTPMALGLGEGAEIRTPMALTVIAGLISSTILTLVVIPTVYSVLDRSK
jgi:multidrug efflux pump subunit AcrB